MTHRQDDEGTAVPRSLPLRHTPVALRAWVGTACVAAVTLPLLLDHRVGTGHTAHEAATALVLVAASVLNIEIGRLLEGGTGRDQRPHLALSTWSLASAIVLSVGWLLPVVTVCYAHARWRGLRVPLWKWVGSAAYVVLAGLGAATVAHEVLGDRETIGRSTSLSVLLAVLAATAVFLAVETVLFHGSAYLNDADDETWLRRTLRQPGFYVTETGVLLVGGLTAAVWLTMPWFLVLLLPVYALAQRAALHEPLRHRADHDAKTGLLRFDTWHRLAGPVVERCRRQQRPWSVLFADLDHFKRFNDTWGHLAGDAALEVAATLIRRELGPDDLVARFGGEEFCVLLPGTGLCEGRELAERIRTAIAGATMADGGSLTLSAGLVAVAPGQDGVDLEAAVRMADHALYEAKEGGRDAVCARPATHPSPRAAPKRLGPATSGGTTS